jgi:septal ring factor EnvC (AmiA/AmiB activator)
MNTIQNIKVINILLVVSLILNMYMLMFPNTNVVIDNSYKQELAKLNESIEGYKQEVKELRIEFTAVEKQYKKQDSINKVLRANLNNLRIKTRKNEKQLIKEVTAIRSDGLYLNIVNSTDLQNKLDSIVQESNNRNG